MSQIFLYNTANMERYYIFEATIVPYKNMYQALAVFLPFWENDFLSIEGN